MTAVMAIANVTADSFSGDGLLRRRSWRSALARQVLAAADAGSAYVDIGAESTRPGAARVPADVERQLVEQAVELVRGTCDLPVSVDTTRAEVAAAACARGARMINDVSGLQQDPEIADVAAAWGCELVIMHNAVAGSTVVSDGSLGAHFEPSAPAEDIVDTVGRGLEAQVAVALARGVPGERIWIDPGLGFGKTEAENLRLVDRIAELRRLPYRILVGPSRKSFIGTSLGLPVTERLEGTAAVVALLAERGVDMVRVHDPLPMHRVVAMVDAVTAASRRR